MSNSRQRLHGKRVLMVLPTLELGGAERQALLLARYLVSTCGARVEVWAFDGPGPAADQSTAHGIPWRVQPVAWPPAWSGRLRSLAAFAGSLRRLQPHIILPYTKHPNVMCGLAWRWSGARLCIWNQRDEGRHFQGKRSEKWAVQQTPWFISNSSHGAHFLVHSLGAKPERVQVVYNGVEPALSAADRAGLCKRLGVDPDCILICMLANLHAYKDHATLLKGWPRVTERLAAVDRQAVLLLAGRFDDTHDSLKAIAYDLELGRSVRFLGQVEDVAGLLTSVDLGVFSSRTEGCPNGVLECMAAGLAVAGTDIAGVREAVGPDGYPYLTPPGDSELLAEKILELATAPALRARLGQQNQRRVEEKFGVQRMCEETVQLIRTWLPSSRRLPFGAKIRASSEGG